MAPANYYSKKELTKIGLDGFALIDEFYGRGRKGRKQQPELLPNYGGRDSYMVTSRPLPPSAAAATPFVAGNHYSTASSSGYSQRHHQYQGYNYYHYSPAESHVGWAPVVAVTTEMTTVVRGGYKAGDAEILMDSYKY